MPRAISKSGKLTNRMRSTKENELTDNPFICLKNIGGKNPWVNEPYTGK
jgi:hypothetical protein